MYFSFLYLSKGCSSFRKLPIYLTSKFGGMGMLTFILKRESLRNFASSEHEKNNLPAYK